MRVLIFGGRTFGVDNAADRHRGYRFLSGLHECHRFTEIIEGGATGGDALGAMFGNINNIPVRSFKADWQASGRAAGPIRNQRMLDEGKPEIGVCFPGGRGTADMKRRLEGAGIEVIECPAPTVQEGR